MDWGLQNTIVERLERLKSDGSLSEFLVSWTGANGRLAPTVTLWPPESALSRHVQLNVLQALTGLVPADRIRVEGS